MQLELFKGLIFIRCVTQEVNQGNQAPFKVICLIQINVDGVDDGLLVDDDDKPPKRDREEITPRPGNYHLKCN